MSNKIFVSAEVQYHEAVGELITAAQVADEALCRATWHGPRDQSELNYASKKIREALKYFEAKKECAT